MAIAMIGAALSVVRTALSPFTDSLLEKWAASKDLSSNVRALELELLAVQALLEHTTGKEIVDNSALKKLLVILQDLGYDAEDVLDELEYFRIQDELEGTSDAADQHAKGCAQNLVLNVQHTAKAVGEQICLPSCFSATDPGTEGRAHSNNTISLARHTNQANREANGWKANLGKCFPCSCLPFVRDNDDDNSPQRNHTNDEPPRLSFDRVDASTRMQHIIEQLRLVRGIVSSTITILGPNCITVPNIAQSRPVTVSKSVETKLYGRDDLKEEIIRQITEGKHCAEVMTVIPIVGLGGMGKTTLAQHIYHSEKVQKHFEVKVWTCVSLNFNVNNLLQEIEKEIPKVEGESESGTTRELIGKRLRNKRFLLVLDDIWDCSNKDEWEWLLAPFKMSQVVGNMIIVTTRFPAQAEMVTTVDPPINLKGLDHQTLKDLFLYFVFGVDESTEHKKPFIETGDKIVSKLKGSPLAAKTVGRILRNQLDLAHWNKVLESKEWEQTDGINEIMPALKLSYDYLPSRLQHCFSYCALFPQDHRFEEVELINFWIGLNVLHSSHGDSKRVEDIGLSNLRDLVNHGFFEEEGEKDGNSCYIIHDLLHDLARKVSSHECLHVDSSQSEMSSIQVLPSVRHLSININVTSVNDRLTRKNCVEDFNILHTRLKVEKLRTLMLFGEHHGCFVKAFGDLFREAKALRVIFLSKASYDMECLLCNFYNLLHLRYLRIESSWQYKARFPNKISRFYHMVVIDVIHGDIIDLPRDITNLVKLRHLLVQNDRIHSSIVDVGKMKSLQELRRFMVRQEDQGFELRQIGHLIDLCELSIYNLQNVQVKEEVDEAKLLTKSHLHELMLHWDNIDRSTDDSTLEEYVLERLKPSSNLLKLYVKGNRGACCPSWLGTNLSIKSLESLCLDGVAWKKFPPIGELWLVNVPREELSANIPEQRFVNLRRLKLCKLTMVQKWAVHAPCQLFPFLEVLIIKDCPQLVELSFQHIACCQQDKEVNANLIPRLSELKITNCPQLLSFPPVPWSEALHSINIEGTGISSLDKLVCEKENSYEYSLSIVGKKDTTDSTIWDVLAFHNLTGLKKLRMSTHESLPLRYLQMLSFLRKLQMSCSSNTFPFNEADSHAKYQLPVESLVISGWKASGKELTQLLVYFPKLSDLQLSECEKVTGLAVNVRWQHATETPGPSSPASEVEQQKGARAEDDVIVASEKAEHGLLLLPNQLQELDISDCPKLSLLRSNPYDDSNEEDGRTGGGGGLQGLTALRRLDIWDCPKLMSAYSSSSFASSIPFPDSLERLRIYGLRIYGAVGTGASVSLSNLTALTSLHIFNCGDLRGEGLFSLLAQGRLTKLFVKGTPNFFVDSEPSQVHEQEIPSCSSKLQELEIDDVIGFTATSIHHSLLFSSLTKLEIYKDNNVECFTDQQEALLFVNSLEDMHLYVTNLQCLPKRLQRLPNLKRLWIGCEAIQMLPKDGLPSSLEELDIVRCLKIQSLPNDCLPDSLQKLVIMRCPAIKSVPKLDDLPKSLRELDVSWSGSEELKSQCRRFINIIPIVKA